MSKDRTNLLCIVEAIDKIAIYTQGIEDADALYGDQKSFDAVLMQFIVIGEMVDRLSESTKEVHTDVPWQKVKGFRNLVAHNYLGVDAEEIWDIIQNHLPKTAQQIHTILQELP